MIASIDRIEDGFAFLELDDRSIIRIAEYELPTGAKEGDCLEVLDGGGFIINEEETERRRAYNRDLFKSLLEG